MVAEKVILEHKHHGMYWIFYNYSPGFVVSNHSWPPQGTYEKKQDWPHGGPKSYLCAIAQAQRLDLWITGCKIKQMTSAQFGNGQRKLKKLPCD